MSHDIHLCQSLSGLRTEPVQSAAGQRHRKIVSAERPTLIRHVPVGAIAKTVASTGRFVAPEYRPAGTTSPIDRSTYPTCAT